MKNAQSGATSRSVNDPTAKGKGPPQQTDAMTMKPMPSSRTEAVQEALRQAIIEQKLRPGARLPRTRWEKPSVPAAPLQGRRWAASL